MINHENNCYRRSPDRYGLYHISESFFDTLRKKAKLWNNSFMDFSFPECNQGLGVQQRSVGQYISRKYDAINPPCRLEAFAGTCLFVWQICRKCPLSDSVIRLVTTLHTPLWLNQRSLGRGRRWQQTSTPSILTYITTATFLCLLRNRYCNCRQINIQEGGGQTCFCFLHLRNVFKWQFFFWWVSGNWLNAWMTAWRFSSSKKTAAVC